VGVWSLVPVNTRWYSCAAPIATTWDRPVAAALRISGITRSIFRSGHGDPASTPGRPLSRLPAKPSTGMSLASAKEATARRNASPRRSSSAGEGIGLCSWAVRKLTTWPPTTRLGTDKVR
jgi:hypothetical protein